MQFPADFSPGDNAADEYTDYLWQEDPSPFLIPKGPTTRLAELLPGAVHGRVQTAVLLVPNPGSGLGRLAVPLGLTEYNLPQALLAGLGPRAAFVGLTRATHLLDLIDRSADHPQAADGLLLTGLDLLLTRLPAPECTQVWQQLLHGPVHRRLVIALPSAFASYGPTDFSRWQQAHRGAIWQG